MTTKTIDNISMDIPEEPMASILSNHRLCTQEELSGSALLNTHLCTLSPSEQVRECGREAHMALTQEEPNIFILSSSHFEFDIVIKDPYSFFTAIDRLCSMYRGSCCFVVKSSTEHRDASFKIVVRDKIEEISLMAELVVTEFEYLHCEEEFMVIDVDLPKLYLKIKENYQKETLRLSFTDNELYFNLEK